MKTSSLILFTSLVTLSAAAFADAPIIPPATINCTAISAASASCDVTKPVADYWANGNNSNLPFDGKTYNLRYYSGTNAGALMGGIIYTYVDNQRHFVAIHTLDMGRPVVLPNTNWTPQPNGSLACTASQGRITGPVACPWTKAFINHKS